MEFKGTKGKWFINRYGNVASENQEVAYMPSLNRQQIKDANALLISKAPEMLEMLKVYLLDLKNIIPSSDAQQSRIYDVEQLIKEATEI